MSSKKRNSVSIEEEILVSAESSERDSDYSSDENASEYEEVSVSEGYDSDESEYESEESDNSEDDDIDTTWNRKIPDDDYDSENMDEDDDPRHYFSLTAAAVKSFNENVEKLNLITEKGVEKLRKTGYKSNKFSCAINALTNTAPESRTIVDIEGFSLENLIKYTSCNRVAHEIVNSFCVPYYDVDRCVKKIPENIDVAVAEYARTVREDIKKLFRKENDGVYNANIIVLLFTDSRVVIDKKTKKKGFKYSFRAIVRNVGFYRCGKHIPLPRDSDGKIVDGYDDQVYASVGSMHAVRMPYSKKENDGNHYFKLITENGEIIDYIGEALKRGLKSEHCVISNVQNEKYVDEVPVQTEGEREEIEEKLKKFKKIESKFKLSTNALMAVLGKYVEHYSPMNRRDWVKGLSATAYEGIRSGWNLEIIEAIACVFSKMDNADVFDETETIGIVSSCIRYISRKPDANHIGARYILFLVGLKDESFKQDWLCKYMDCRPNISVNDNYYWKDFDRKYRGKQFPDMKSLREAVRYDINRVLAFDTMSQSYIIKQRKDFWCGTSMINKKSHMDLKMFYVDGKKKKRGETEAKDNVECVRLLDLCQERGMLNSYCGFSVVPKPGCFTTFVGYEHTETKPIVDQKRLDEFLEFVKEVWCKSDDGLYKFVLDWMSNIVKNPHDRPRTALFLQSPHQGIGKNFVTDIFGKYVLGEHASVNIPSLASLLDKFNDDTRDKKLLVVNEIVSGGYSNPKHNFDVLKTLITDETIQINTKFRSTYHIANIRAYVFISNHDDSIKIDEGDRRFTCLDVDPKYKGDVNFWKKFDKQFANLNFGQDLYSFLMTRESEQSYVAYDTPLKQRIIGITADSVDSFYNHTMKAYINSDDNDVCVNIMLRGKARTISGKDFYYYYKMYCGENGMGTVKRDKFVNKLTNGMSHKVDGSDRFEYKKSGNMVFVVPKWWEEQRQQINSEEVNRNDEASASEDEDASEEITIDVSLESVLEKLSENHTSV